MLELGWSIKQSRQGYLDEDFSFGPLFWEKSIHEVMEIENQMYLFEHKGYNKERVKVRKKRAKTV